MSVHVTSFYWQNCDDLKGAQLLAILALADNCDDDGVCFPGVKSIAKKLRKTERATQITLEGLRDLGHIRIEYNQGKQTPSGRTNLYHLLAYQKAQKAGVKKVAPLDEGVKKVAPLRGEGLRGQGVKKPSPKPSVKPSVKNIMGATRKLHSEMPAVEEPKQQQSQKQLQPPKSENYGKVFARLEQEFLTPGLATVEAHAEVADKYGFETWLRAFEKTKRSARNSAVYVEKVAYGMGADPISTNDDGTLTVEFEGKQLIVPPQWIGHVTGDDKDKRNRYLGILLARVRNGVTDAGRAAGH